MVQRPAKSAKQTLLNTTRTGMVYDTEGHSLGAGERIEVDGLDDVGKAAVDAGYLRAEPVEDAKK